MSNFVYVLKSWEEGQKTGKLWVVLRIGENLGEFMLKGCRAAVTMRLTWQGFLELWGEQKYFEKCHYAL